MKRKKLIKGAAYEVFWLDTYNFLGWHFEDEISGKTINKEFQTTIGYFVKQVKCWYIFAMHKNPNVELGFPEWGNIAYIPKKTIVRIIAL